MPIRFDEGDVFAIPLRSGGYAIGVIARVSTDNSGGLLGYFFGKKFESTPSKDVTGSLHPFEAIRVLRFGDLFLQNKKWPIVGSIANWNRKDWPMPDFVRKDDISKKAWRARYSEDRISELISEHPEPFNSSLEKDSVFGAGAIELLLTKLVQ